MAKYTLTKLENNLNNSLQKLKNLFQKSKNHYYEVSGKAVELLCYYTFMCT